MKKFFVSAMMLVAAAAMMVSCSNSTQSVQSEESETAALTDSIKSQAIALFRNINIERSAILNEVVVTNTDIRIVPVKFFLPLEYAEKVQTLYQKNQVLGILLADKFCDEVNFAGANNAEQRDAQIAKLAVESNAVMNIPAISDSLKGLSREEQLAKIDVVTGKNIEDALENESADEALVVSTYTAIETILNSVSVAELVGEYDQQVIFKSVLTHKAMMADIVSLFNLLNPYYQSLDEMKGLMESLDNLVKADGVESTDAALMTFVNYCRENRAKIQAY